MAMIQIQFQPAPKFKGHPAKPDMYRRYKWPAN